MKVTIYLDDEPVNGCRIDVYEDLKLTIKENTETKKEMLFRLDRWVTEQIRKESTRLEVI